MEHPNKLLENFTGVIELHGSGRDNVQPNNVLLRGCVLRNTDFAIGIVVNTGHDTKIMMSSSGTPSKTSALESEGSRQIKRIIALLALLCLTGSTGMAIWNNDLDIKVSEHWYLHWNPNIGGYWVVQFFYFFLLHATFIPVSLYVSMSIVRFYQSKFMNLDLDMYYEKTDTPALVRTMTLNEELGQISHIFSDKTGTLTCNVMDFRKANIAGVSYGEGITEIGKVAWKLQGKEISPEVLRADELAKAKSVDHVSFYCSKYESFMSKGGIEKAQIGFFFRALSICHDVIIEHTDHGVIPSASNPDDEALVAAAKYFGFEFRDREDKIIIVNNTDRGCVERYELLETLAFSSLRKRMSVVVRDLSTNKLMLFTKGADTVMLERILSKAPNMGADIDTNEKMFEDQPRILRETLDAMKQYSVEGLRCLLIAFSTVKESTFQNWHERYRAAFTDIRQIGLRKKGEKNLIDDLQDELERDLFLIGCTAIEDRLQTGVPECIEVLAQAGIKIWMLTGDKEETALNIAIACNLVQPREYMKHVIVNSQVCPTGEEIYKLLLSEIYEMGNDSTNRFPRALIIDGPSLLKVFENDLCKGALLEFGKLCKAVVGCRVSPDQKNLIVRLIKDGAEGVRTLAIGDGANDVAMIQAAHIGVGIKGEEGLQAVNSADFAIAQFRFLGPLLLKHGRSNYIRLCTVVIYMFYKNIFMSLAQFWFSFFTGFSGQKYYTEGGIQLFNVVFTAVPVLLLGIYDIDLSYATVRKFPKLYQDSVSNMYFSTQRLWWWLFQAALESIICALVPLLLLENFGHFGFFETHWQAGALCFTAVVCISNLKIFVLQYRVHYIHVVCIFASILMWFLVAIIVNVFTSIDYDYHGVWFQDLSRSSFWAALFIIILGISLKDVLVNFTLRTHFTANHHILIEAESMYGEPNALRREALVNAKSIGISRGRDSSSDISL